VTRHCVRVCTCRVGRTGRAGDKEGVAYTLLLGRKDAHFAGLLVTSLSLGGQDIPRELHSLAMNVSPCTQVCVCVCVSVLGGGGYQGGCTSWQRM
jgi:hypothetical protein